MKDLIWDIAKSGEDQLENTDLQTIEEPKELFVARGVSLEAKDSTYKINKFVDNKIALDVQDKGAIKISDTVFSYSKSYKSKTIDLKRLLDWTTNKKLNDDEIENLIAICGNNFVPKLRGLDAVAEKKGMEKQLARDTFIEKKWDEEPKLQVINTSNEAAPIWAKDLNEMERKKGDNYLNYHENFQKNGLKKRQKENLVTTYPILL